MALQQADFDYIKDLIQKRAAIVLDDNKHYFVESRLMPVVEEQKLETITQLVGLLKRGGGAVLAQRVTEAITIHETSFFRDLHPFKALREQILPGVMQKRANTKTLSMWCGASSSGQEPYTIAMILREQFPELRDWNQGST